MTNVNDLLDRYDRWEAARADLEARRIDPDAEFDLDEVGQLNGEAETLIADLVAAIRKEKSGTADESN